MSRVPGAAEALIEPAKLRDYLLNAAHPDNGGKAKLFEAFGFSQAMWRQLDDALRRHVVTNEVVEIVPSRYGSKYVVECNLPTPDGRDPCRTSIWVVLRSDPPRFVTAY